MTAKLNDQLIFRADGSQQMGLGHLVRSLSLAIMLRDGFRCRFLVRDLPAGLRQRMQDAHIDLTDIPDSVAPADEPAWIAHTLLTTPAIVVLDGYHFNTDYRATLRATGSKVVFLDDLLGSLPETDVVINHSGGLSATDYTLPLYTKLCLGPAFAFVNPVFRQMAAQTDSSRRADSSGRVLVCFGGADPHNLTEPVVRQLLTVEAATHIDVVVGSAYGFIDTLTTLVASTNGRVRLFHNITPDQLARLLASSTWAITSASSVAYEAATVGIGLLVVNYVANQQHLYRYLTQTGLAIGLGSREAIDTALLAYTLTTNPAATIAAQRLHFPDAQPTLARLFQKLANEFSISLRPACADDVNQLFAWANDPDARRFALNTAPIAYETHCCWFAARLASEKTALYIAEIDGQPAGQVRFDADTDGETYIISYAIAPAYRGQGLGEGLLRLAISRLCADKPITALCGYVHPENIPSVRVFEQLGFARHGTDKGFYLFSLPHENR